MKTTLLSAFTALALLGAGAAIADGGERGGKHGGYGDHKGGHHASKQGHGHQGHGKQLGRSLLTEDEREGFREAMREAETEEDRREIRKSMRDTVKLRAKEKGIDFQGHGKEGHGMNGYDCDRTEKKTQES